MQTQPTELPATTEVRWRRRHFSQGHKAGPLAVFLISTSLVPFKCVFQGFSDPSNGEDPKCRESGRLAADTTKSSGSLHSFQTTPSHRTTCRDTWEACGLTSEPLARKAGNSVEMTEFTCEANPSKSWTASKGSNPRTAPRS